MRVTSKTIEAKFPLANLSGLPAGTPTLFVGLHPSTGKPVKAAVASGVSQSYVDAADAILAMAISSHDHDSQYVALPAISQERTDDYLAPNGLWKRNPAQFYNNLAAFPLIMSFPSTDVIYVARDTGKLYQWVYGSTNAYVEISTGADLSSYATTAYVDAQGVALLQILSQYVFAPTSTDNAIVRFNGTTGAVQNSLATIDDSGNLIAGQVSARAPANSTIALIARRFSASASVNTFEVQTEAGVPVCTVNRNGTGFFAGNVAAGGGASFGGNVLPSVANTLDLGAPLSKFRHVYMNGSIFIDGVIRSTLDNVSVPALQLGPANNYGVGYVSGNLLFFANGGLACVLTDSLKNYRIPSDWVYSWDSASSNATGSYTGLGRPADGIVEINKGVTIANGGTYGSLRAAGITLTELFKVGEFTVASLPPAASNAGQSAQVIDSTVAALNNYGAVVAGGGSNRVQVFCIGTNWVIA